MVSCRDSETGMSAGSRSAYFASSPCQCGWVGYMQYIPQQLVVSEQYIPQQLVVSEQYMQYIQYIACVKVIGCQSF